MTNSLCGILSMVTKATAFHGNRHTRKTIHQHASVIFGTKNVQSVFFFTLRKWHTIVHVINSDVLNPNIQTRYLKMMETYSHRGGFESWSLGTRLLSPLGEASESRRCQQNSQETPWALAPKSWLCVIPSCSVCAGRFEHHGQRACSLG